MIDLRKYFVRVSESDKKIIGGIQVLPENTPEVSNFRGLPEEKLFEYGYLSIFSDKLDEYTPEYGVFEYSKDQLKAIIALESEDVDNVNYIEYNGISLRVDDKLILSLLVKAFKAQRSKDLKFKLKVLNKYHELTSDEIIELCEVVCDAVEDHSSSIENLNEQIDACTNFTDFSKLEL